MIPSALLALTIVFQAAVENHGGTPPDSLPDLDRFSDFHFSEISPGVFDTTRLPFILAEVDSAFTLAPDGRDGLQPSAPFLFGPDTFFVVVTFTRYVDATDTLRFGKFVVVFQHFDGIPEDGAE